MSRFQSPFAFVLGLCIAVISVFAARWITGQIFSLTGMMDLLVGLIFAAIFAGIICLTVEKLGFKIFKERK
jgi:hypothetical protein